MKEEIRPVRQKKKRQDRKGTFRNFDTFDRLVVYGASAFFDEPVTLDTEIQDICALYAELSEFFQRNVDDISRILSSGKRNIRIFKTYERLKIRGSNLVFGDISFSGRPWLFCGGSLVRFRHGLIGWLGKDEKVMRRRLDLCGFSSTQLGYVVVHTISQFTSKYQEKKSVAAKQKSG